MSAGDREEQDQGEYERKDEESTVSDRAQHFVANIGEVAHGFTSSSPVRFKNASSSPAPRPSMSRAAGERASRPRKAASDDAASLQVMTKPSPRCSAFKTPVTLCTTASSAPGMVARMV